MKKALHIIMVAGTAVLLSGCAGAAFNRVNLTLHRNITVGQELIDLQAAHEKGIISDTEYAKAKANILNILSQLEGIDVE